MKTTNKDIKNAWYAQDLNHMTETEIQAVFEYEQGQFTCIAYAWGAYGCNARMYRGNITGTLYKAYDRTSLLYRFGA